MKVDEEPPPPPTAEALASLPIFPLPDVVLFPGTILPLHIFEERYRAMTRDVMKGHKLIAVARLRPGYQKDYEGRPAVHTICGLGAVVASEKLGDGRWNIVLRGLGRVKIAEELPPTTLYRKVRAVPYGPEVDEAALADGHAQIVTLCDHLALRLDEGGDSLRELVRGERSAADTTDVLAGALVSDSDDRQTMLEEGDPARRQGMLIDHLAGLIRRFSPPSGTRN